MSEAKVYNKLVRDRIPFIISADGKKPVFEILSNGDYGKAIFEKMFEEVAEYRAAKNTDEAVNELVDIYEVLLCTVPYLGFTEEQFKELCDAKRRSRGSFDERILLKEVRD